MTDPTPSEESMEKAREEDLGAVADKFIAWDAAYRAESARYGEETPGSRRSQLLWILGRVRAQAREAAERERPLAAGLIGRWESAEAAYMAGKAEAEKERDETRAQEEYWHSAAKQLGIDYYASQEAWTETERLRVASVGRAEAAEHRAEAAEARLREVEQENERRGKALSEAAQEINCAGPVAHRIRILRKEHAEYRDALIAEVRELRAALEEYRLRCSGWTFYAAPSPVHSGVPRAADDSWEVHTRNVEALLARTETPKEPKP